MTKVIKKIKKIKADGTGIRYNMVFIKWTGSRDDLGLTKGQMYSYARLGEAVGITAGSMRGRLMGHPECGDNLMWKKGARKPRANWVSGSDFPRLECDADRISQKHLRVSL